MLPSSVQGGIGGVSGDELAMASPQRFEKLSRPRGREACNARNAPSDRGLGAGQEERPHGRALGASSGDRLHLPRIAR